MIEPVTYNTKLKIEKIQAVESIDEKLKQNRIHGDPKTGLTEWMIQDFISNMYASVDECSFSVNNKQEW